MRMETLLQEIFKLLGEFSFVVIMAIWIVGKRIENRLAKDLEIHREKLRLETEKDLECYKEKLNLETEKKIAILKSNLIIESKKHEISYSRLHQKRAEIIEGLYQRLRELEDAVSAFEFQIIVFGKPLDKQLPAAHNIMEYFRNNKIYFSTELSVAILDLIYAIRSPIDEYEYTNLDLSEEQKAELFKKTKDETNKKVLAVETIVENEFRRMLGVIPEHPQ